MRFHPSILTLSVLLALSATWQRPLHAQVPVGQYVVDQARSDDISAAINNATADFNFIKKPIARKRLRATNPQPRTLSIRMIGDSIDIVLNGELGVRALLNTTKDWRGLKGEPMKVRTTLQGATLTNTFSAKDGEKTNTYRLRSDGMLELHVRLTSPRLKRPVEYNQLFRRS